MALPVWFVLYMQNKPVLELTWPIQSPATFLLLVMLYPVLEEMVFRGLIQGELMRRTAFKRQFLGITRANILTSTVFASAHLFTHPPGMAALVFLPSLAFGYFRDRHDGWLLPAILLHIYYNLGYFLIFRPVL
ncbi:MAG: JDVT-CTERM system glutamic-type intramembrane protease [Mariprofundus sp.]|nr:JDVT-CTERM system glutamic-type intramembrane protease [Mariprofundus sp.]